ncbi:MAG TPA: threonine/serine dehydratase [Pyrinomonadaceae bacterium]|nr:threonine/serine dehydratase [Pyrinomonadaceae bacterium]
MIDTELIQEARRRIAEHIRVTPLERSRTLSGLLSTNVFVKYELFQTTGAFKARGAFNKILSLTSEERSRGVVAVSGGNHAQAVAYAASSLGVRSVVLMPESTPQNYIDGTRSYGAAVELLPTIAAAFDEIKRYQSEGMIFVHPFDDPLVMAGQGTVGLEIMDALPEVTDVILSIGGGGMAAGVSVAIKSLKPSVKMWGVETVGADAMSQAMAAGRPVQLPAITSIAKTLGAPSVSDETLALTHQNFEGVTVVTDGETVDSLRFILERLKVLTEPAAACTLAAALKLKENFGPDRNVVLILCGGNLLLGDLCRYISDPSLINVETAF